MSARVIPSPATTLTLEHASTILTLAFSADPAVRWMYPDPFQYLRNFPRFVEVLAGKSFAHGILPDEEAIVNLVKQSVSEDLQEDLFAFFEQMGSFHPAQLHWYLPLICVDPSVQRAGYGSKLMKKRLARCDADQALAYLEATNPRNCTL